MGCIEAGCGGGKAGFAFFGLLDVCVPAQSATFVAVD